MPVVDHFYSVKVLSLCIRIDFVYWFDVNHFCLRVFDKYIFNDPSLQAKINGTAKMIRNKSRNLMTSSNNWITIYVIHFVVY